MVEREIAPEISTPVYPDEVLQAVWESELVDHQTRMHRLKGPHILTSLYGGYGLAEEDYIALPMRAAIVGAEDDSRFSFSLILLNSDKRKRFRAARDDAPDVDLNILNAVEKDDLFGNNYQGFELYLTPDELVTGNIDSARKLRLKGIRGHRHVRHWSGGNHSIQEYFKERYIQYGMDAKESTRRHKRFYRKLQERASYEENSEEWIRHFLEERRALTLPSLPVFREYLSQTDGAIILPHSDKHELPPQGDIFSGI